MYLYKCDNVYYVVNAVLFVCFSLRIFQMEKISDFLDYCYSIGCQKWDMFQTVDLYEGENIPQVSERFTLYSETD